MTDSTEADIVERLLRKEFFSDDLMSARSEDDANLIDKYRAERRAAAAEITRLRAERDAARQAVHIFLPPGNEAMEDIIWEGQPDNALMTIRIRYGQFKRARAILATDRGGS